MNTLKNIVTIVVVTFCSSSGILMAQNDALIHQYKFDGNLEDAVGDSHGVYQDGWWLEPVINNFIDDRDGNAQSALNFDAAGGNGYMIFVGRFSPVQEGVDGEITVTFWGLWHGSTGSWQDIVNKRDNYDDNIISLSDHSFLSSIFITNIIQENTLFYIIFFLTQHFLSRTFSLSLSS